MTKSSRPRKKYVILTTVGRKNSLQGVEALMVQCHSEVQSTEESPLKSAKA